MSENGTQEKAFDPSAHLIDLRGKQYLEVKWRLAWLRDIHPDASILTMLVTHTADEAVFNASVSLPGGGSATGYGAETRTDFGDYLEKAETKALGRALAALGFGTQFCDDFDEGGAVTDSPVTRPRKSPAPKTANTGKANPNQISIIMRFLKDKHGEDEQAQCATVKAINPHAVNEAGTALVFGSLTQDEAGNLIVELQKKRQEPERKPVAAGDPGPEQDA